MTLIFPNGYGEFQQRCEQWEPKGTFDKEPDWLTKGNRPSKEMDKRADLQEHLAWFIPDHFCPACGRKSIYKERCEITFTMEGGLARFSECRGNCQPSTGIFIFDQPRPELHMGISDAIRYRRCAECKHDSIFNDRPRLDYPGGVWRNVQERIQLGIEHNIEGWIKAQILSGEEPLRYVG